MDMIFTKPENPTNIDVEYLTKFPEFTAWLNKEPSKEIKEPDSKNQTPDDMIELCRKAKEDVLHSELLEKIKTISNQGFELLILALCKKMNYGDWAEHTGKSGDQGIDGIIKEDRLGLGEVYLQAKKWERQVTSQNVRDFAGSLQATKTRKGIFMATSDFTQDSKDWVKNLRDTTIILINGRELAKLAVEYNVGVSITDEIKIKKIDHDYFEQLL